jgi:hypothetical protein
LEISVVNAAKILNRINHLKFRDKIFLRLKE